MATNTQIVTIEPLRTETGSIYMYEAVSNLKVTAGVEMANEPGVAGRIGPGMPRRAEFDVDFLTPDSARPGAPKARSPPRSEESQINIRGKVVIDMLPYPAFAQYNRLSTMVGKAVKITMRTHPPEDIVWVVDSVTADDDNKDSNHFSGRISLIEYIGYERLTHEGFIKLGSTVLSTPLALLGTEDLETCDLITPKPIAVGTFEEINTGGVFGQRGDAYVITKQSGATYTESTATYVERWALARLKSPDVRDPSFMPKNRDALGRRSPYQMLVSAIRDGSHRVSDSNSNEVEYEGGLLERKKVGIVDKEDMPAIATVLLIKPPQFQSDAAGNPKLAYCQDFDIDGVSTRVMWDMRGEVPRFIFDAPWSKVIIDGVDEGIKREAVVFTEGQGAFVTPNFFAGSSLSKDVDLVVGIVDRDDSFGKLPVTTAAYIANPTRYQLIVINGRNLG